MRALLILLLAWPVLAQRFDFGVKAGVPVTRYFETGSSGGLHGSAIYSAATRRYTVAVSGEWRLNRRFGFEVDTAYHRMGYVAIVNFFESASGNFRDSALDVKGDSWDFPVLAKYRFLRARQLFVAAGGVVRYLGPVRGRGQETDGSLVTQSSSTTPIDTASPSDLSKRFYPGITGAIGQEFHAGRFRLVPELRYTRWTANISQPGGLLRWF